MLNARHTFRTTTALLIGLLCAAANARAAEMTAQLQPEEVYLGTQAMLVVQVINGSGTGWPSVNAVAGLRITQYGSPNLIQDLISGITRRDYRFLITPEKAGTFQIPGVSLKIDGAVLKRGPFTLRVREAPVKFYAARIEPPEVLPGETAQLAVSYQGVRPGVELVVPEVAGLAIRATGPGRLDVTRLEGLPITTRTYTVIAAKLGTYRIAGITFDGVPADPVTLTVSPFVILGTQTQDDSVEVGHPATVHVVIRGLPASTPLKLVAPAGLKCVPAPDRPSGPAGASVFSFEVTPTEPGTLTISEIQLPDGKKAPLKSPIVLAVRQGGQGGILACRGKARGEQSVVGEPFIVDYEVFFRGDLRGAGIDPSQASFTNKEHIRIERVENPSYPNWRGQPIQVRYGQGQITMLSGSGELNGQKEQLLRFSLKITPMAAGELSLDGLRVILAIQVKEERRTAVSIFSSSRTEQYDQVAKVPPHRVIDPPGISAPPLYRGAVGTFTFTTELDRTTAAAMSPLTLTMTITGEGVGPQFNPPPTTEMPELTRGFDVSPTVSAGEVKGTTITFTQVIRPRSEAVKELPALPLVCYDYKKKKYDTVYSLPIPIQVNPGSLVGAGSMEVATATPVGAANPAPTTAVSNGAPLQAAFGANYTTLGTAGGGEPLGVAAVVAMLAGGPLCVVLAWAGKRLYRQRRPEAEIRQRRRALVATLDRLEGGDDFFVRLADVLQAYLRLTFNLPPGELSADLLARAFERSRMDTRLWSEAQDLLSTCDAGRFATGSVAPEEKNRLLRRTRSLLAEIEKCHG